jgi:hypothetical protein
MEGRAFFLYGTNSRNKPLDILRAFDVKSFSPSLPRQKAALLGRHAKASRKPANTQETAIRHANDADMLFIPGIIAG